jgi:hypothetical protein
MTITALPFGPWTSNSGLVIGAASGTSSGTMVGLNFPALNITVQTNNASGAVFSGTVNVQLIGSLDGINYFPLASGLFSGGATSVLNTVALVGPVAYLGTQITSYSGVGTGNSLTTYIWAR